MFYRGHVPTISIFTKINSLLFVQQPLIEVRNIDIYVRWVHRELMTEPQLNDTQRYRVHIYETCNISTHYNDVIMNASQITGLAIVYSCVYSGADQRKHQSSASLAFVRGIYRSPVNSPHKGPVTRKMYPFDDVIMGPCYDTDAEFDLNRSMDPDAVSLGKRIAWAVSIGQFHERFSPFQRSCDTTHMRKSTNMALNIWSKAMPPNEDDTVIILSQEFNCKLLNLSRYTRFE